MDSRRAAPGTGAGAVAPGRLGGGLREVGAIAGRRRAVCRGALLAGAWRGAEGWGWKSPALIRSISLPSWAKNEENSASSSVAMAAASQFPSVC
jgi:hypothetical protein